jgi:NMD protein affecting ribosome stability and mRNA decay
MIAFCSECGGTNVREAMWVDCNKNEPVNEFSDCGDIETEYCPDCERYGTVHWTTPELYKTLWPSKG